MKRFFALALSLVVPGLCAAEWKEAHDLKTAFYEEQHLSCELRFKRSYSYTVPGSSGNVVTYFPITTKTVSVSDGKQFTDLLVSLQPKDIEMFTGGTFAAVDSSTATKLLALHKTGTFHQALLGTRLTKDSGGTLTLAYQRLVVGEKGVSSIAAVTALVNPDQFKLEADCSNTKFAGDANHDGCTDMKDVYIWYSNMQLRNASKVTLGARFEDGDFNQDSILDYKDLDVISANYLKGCNIFRNVGQSI